MSLKLYQKFLILFSFLLIVPLLLVLVSAFQIFKQKYVEMTYQDLYSRAMLLEYSIRSVDKLDVNDDYLESMIIKAGSESDVRITIVARDGTVVADSLGNPKKMENHFNRPEIKEALLGLRGQVKRFSSTLDKEYMYVAVPVYKDGSIIGAIRTSISFSRLNTMFEGVLLTISIVVLLALLVSGFIAYRFTKGFNRSITELTMVADGISNGNFTREIHIQRKDEIGELAESFNRMSGQLNKNITALKQEESKLSAVLNSIMDGVIATDEHGRILFANPAAESLFGITYENAQGTSLVGVLRNSEIYDAVSDALKFGCALRKEVKFIDGRYFSLSVAPIMTAEGHIDGTVIYLKDMTEFKKLEKVKGDFVANVSHDLRTPLTSIKGFAETLLEDDTIEPDMREHFLEIIKNETDNLIEIVSDLLNISELESGRVKLNLKRVHLNDILAKTLDLLSLKIAAKPEVTVINQVEPELPMLNADAFRIQEVLVNLIDNALKYTASGQIRVSAQCINDGFMEISIADTGQGIPQADQDRIFERFYRVQKDRDKRTGGTGLGLSIVKHIVQLHGGWINLRSVEGAGTNISIALPCECNGLELSADCKSNNN